MLTPGFTTSSCGSCSDAKLADFCNIYEKSHYKGMEKRNVKISVFWTFQNRNNAALLYILSYIYNMIFVICIPFMSELL